jgi:hypothetical protein
MKNYIKFKLFVSVAFLALTAAACDENNSPDPIISTENYPTATFQASNGTVNEKDGICTIKITTDKMLTRGITFSAEQIGGTAVLHEDYDIVDATLEPFTNEATITVQFYDDTIIEGDQTLKLQVTTPSLANRYLLNPTVVLPSYDIIIKNYVSNTLDLLLNYDKSFVDGTTAKTLCGIGYDMDFYVLDADGNDTGNYQAAASGCPEVLTVSAAKFPNGSYDIYYDLYDDAGLPAMNTPEFTIPISVDYTRAGFAAGNYKQEAEFAITSKSTSGFDYVVTIVVNNGVYTLKNRKGTVAANARKSNNILKTIQQARLKNNK